MKMRESCFPCGEICCVAENRQNGNRGGKKFYRSSMMAGRVSLSPLPTALNGVVTLLNDAVLPLRFGESER
jgi:hypothetical protein